MFILVSCKVQASSADPSLLHTATGACTCYVLLTDTLQNGSGCPGSGVRDVREPRAKARVWAEQELGMGSRGAKDEEPEQNQGKFLCGEPGAAPRGLAGGQP